MLENETLLLSLFAVSNTALLGYAGMILVRLGRMARPQLKGVALLLLAGAGLLYLESVQVGDLCRLGFGDCFELTADMTLHHFADTSLRGLLLFVNFALQALLAFSIAVTELVLVIRIKG